MIAGIFQHELVTLMVKCFIDRVDSSLDIIKEKEFQRIIAIQQK